MTTAQTAKPTAYDRCITGIVDLVADANSALGLNAAGTTHRVTFGYVGNWNPGGRDDRLWSIFLPHPGRVGTSEDGIGSFRTDDLEGAVRARRELAAFVKGLRFARSNAAR